LARYTAAARIEQVRKNVLHLNQGRRRISAMIERFIVFEPEGIPATVYCGLAELFDH